MGSGDFKSNEEFREVIDRVFELMSRDPDMGPKLRDAQTPQRYVFPDLDEVVNITYNEDDSSSECLLWEWTDEVAWEPEVEMKMDSSVANRYFQGKENVAMAIARRRIKTSGNVKKALNLIPITKPVFAQYRDMLDAEYPHLLE
jgi:putative sterol carrier protein